MFSSTLGGRVYKCICQDVDLFIWKSTRVKSSLHHLRVSLSNEPSAKFTRISVITNVNPISPSRKPAVKISIFLCFIKAKWNITVCCYRDPRLCEIKGRVWGDGFAHYQLTFRLCPQVIRRAWARSCCQFRRRFNRFHWLVGLLLCNELSHSVWQRFLINAFCNRLFPGVFMCFALFVIWLYWLYTYVNLSSYT